MLKKFIIGFFQPILGFLIILLVVAVALFPIVIGIAIQGTEMHYSFGIALIVWILVISGVLNVMD